MICDMENCGADLAFSNGGFNNNIFGETFCEECNIEHIEGTFYELEQGENNEE